MSETSDPSPAETAKARLREDLRAAMRARNAAEATVLRTLIAALDNAEALPGPRGHVPYVVRPFGDPAVEVARRTLSADEVEAVLEGERAERLAATLEAEAAVVARYLSE